MTRRGFAGYCARRVAVLCLMVLLLSFGTFSLLALAPGNPEQILLANRPSTPAIIASLRTQYHLNQPFLVQYWLWLRGAIHLNFGDSLVSSQPVMASIKTSLPVTAYLGIYAFVLTLVFGVGLGVVAAIRRDTLADRAIVGGAVIGLSAPVFASGLLLLYLFAVKLAVFPAFGGGTGFGGQFSHLTLPAITLALSATALIVRLTRAGVAEALEQDYVAFARARGLTNRRVVMNYAVRNALIPIVTSAGLVMSYVFTSAVLVENTFSLNGLGSLLVQSVDSKDLPVVQAIAILFAAAVMVINLLTDFIYLAIDPRIRYEKARS